MPVTFVRQLPNTMCIVSPAAGLRRPSPSVAVPRRPPLSSGPASTVTKKPSLASHEDLFPGPGCGRCRGDYRGWEQDSSWRYAMPLQLSQLFHPARPTPVTRMLYNESRASDAGAVNSGRLPPPSRRPTCKETLAAPSDRRISLDDLRRAEARCGGWK